MIFNINLTFQEWPERVFINFFQKMANTEDDFLHEDDFDEL